MGSWSTLRRVILNAVTVAAPALAVIVLLMLIAAIEAVTGVDLPQGIKPRVAAGGGVVHRHPEDVRTAGAVPITTETLRAAVQVILEMMPTE